MHIPIAASFAQQTPSPIHHVTAQTSDAGQAVSSDSVPSDYQRMQASRQPTPSLLSPLQRAPEPVISAVTPFLPSTTIQTHAPVARPSVPAVSVEEVKVQVDPIMSHSSLRTSAAPCSPAPQQHLQPSVSLPLPISTSLSAPTPAVPPHIEIPTQQYPMHSFGVSPRLSSIVSPAVSSLQLPGTSTNPPTESATLFSLPTSVIQQQQQQQIPQPVVRPLPSPKIQPIATSSAATPIPLQPSVQIGGLTQGIPLQQQHQLLLLQQQQQQQRQFVEAAAQKAATPQATPSPAPIASPSVQGAAPQHTLQHIQQMQQMWMQLQRPEVLAQYQQQRPELQRPDYLMQQIHMCTFEFSNIFLVIWC